MPAQVSILNRKVLTNAGTCTWYSDAMNWTGYKRADVTLQVHGLNTDNTAALTFEGTPEPGENAVWTAIPADSSYSDPSVLATTGVNKYVRVNNLYPYMRVKVTIGGTSTLKLAEVSVAGQLLEYS